MTEQEIKEIETRCEAATPVLLEVVHNSWETSTVYTAKRDTVALFYISSDVTEETQDKLEARKESYAEFFAHARTDLPRLVAAYRQQQEEIERYKKALSEIYCVLRRSEPCQK